ncbi:putative disease resistance protein At3g14460 [Cicer arietinum]
MHNLINDLATMVSSPYCIKLDEHELNDKVRHLSYNRKKYDSYNKFDKLYGLKGLRTFLALPLQEPGWLLYSISDRVLRDLLPAMKQLRVLSLSNYTSITELPNSVGNLISLRYLNLSNTAIERLPSVTCNLYNLQTLLLFGCLCLIELPEEMGKLVNLRNLDIRGTQLKEIPVQIARLQNLQTLSDFAISNHRDGLKARELGKFPHLKGNLSISKLQNINDPFDAFEANLKMKEQIDNLELQWIPHGSNDTTSQSSQIEALVLEQLQPSTNLKNLTIKGYGGTSFPNWLGDSLFNNMVYLHISGCDHCSLLPPVGQLHGLKKLTISSMKSIKSVGSEFYGSGSFPSFQPFPSLETLDFEEMPKWEEWNLIGGAAIEFPNLRNLSLETCPILKGNVPRNLPSLIALELRSCDLLLESGHSANQIIQLKWYPLNSLRQLTLVGFPSLMSFPRHGLPKTLQSLTIHDCENLEFLPCESLPNYSPLEDITIFYSCNSMASFTLGSLPVLKNLHISGCKNLKSIFIAEEDDSQSLSFIQSITIWHCDELASFSLSGFSTPNLIRFEVCWCKKLHSLPEPIDTFPYIQELRIVDLPNLQHFAKEGLPIILRELTVGGILCNTNITKWGLERLTCLSELHIWGDDIMNAFMKVEVPLLPASVISLHISLLYDIKCLDGKWFRHLTSLQNLECSFCDNLKSLPEQGLPSSLFVLSISQCPLLEASWRRKRGKEWRKIAYIPCIVINNKIIT